MSSGTPPAPLRDGDFLGSYRVLRRLGGGKRWEVYLARSAAGQRQAVLKTPAAGAAMDTAALLARAERASRVEHPGLARVYEAGVDRGRLFVAEEFVADQRGAVADLAAEWLDHGRRLPEERARILAAHLLEAVAAAHRAGIVLGGIPADKVLLNAQRRPKLVDAGLRADATEEGRAEDLHALARLFSWMLTGSAPPAGGPAAGPLQPASAGVPAGWTTVLRALAEAGPGAMPDLAALREALFAIDDTRPRRPGARVATLWVAAAGALLAALTTTAVLALKTARREPAPPALSDSTPQSPADGQDTVAELLAAATEARDRNDLPAAQDACRKALTLDPHNAAATRLLADCRTAAGLQQTRAARDQAEAAWRTLRDVDPGDGFAELLGEAGATLAAAREALASQEFGQAEALYRQTAEKAAAVARLDRQRGEARPSREEALQARDEAEAARAPSLAAGLWQQAEDLAAKARNSFATRDFPAAAQAWRDAAGLYGRAARRASGAGRLDLARRELEAALAAAGNAALQAAPAEARARVEALRAEAADLEARDDTAGAAMRLEAARQTLEEGLQQADAVLRRRHFEDVMARVRETFGRNALGETERLLREALAIPGFRENEDAAKLLAEVRARRAREAAGSPRTPENLVLNGDFTMGQAGTPVGWTAPDNLTVFWVDGGARGTGKCLRLDTDVYRSEWEAHRQNPAAPVTRTPTSGLKYDTVAGTAGVAVFSHPIPVEPGRCYRVGYDVRGQGEPFLFVLGYWRCGPEHIREMGEKSFFRPVPGGPSFSLVAHGTSGEEKRPPRAGDYILCYRRRVVARFPPGAEGTWRRYETVLRLPEQSPIQVVLLELYAYWPPGEYWFDNVRMEAVPDEELHAYEARREARGAEANFGSPCD